MHPPSCVVKVVCGLDHTLLLLEEGSVWSCGWASDGQTGTYTYTLISIGSSSLRYTAGVGAYENTGQLKLVDLGSRKVCFLSSCADSSFALTGEEYIQFEIVRPLVSQSVLWFYIIYGSI